MTQLNYSDFYKVPELKFDIRKLREDLDETTTLKQQERNSNTAAATQDTLSTSDPYQIYIH